MHRTTIARAILAVYRRSAAWHRRDGQAVPCHRDDTPAASWGPGTPAIAAGGGCRPGLAKVGTDTMDGPHPGQAPDARRDRAANGRAEATRGDRSAGVAGARHARSGGPPLIGRAQCRRGGDASGEAARSGSADLAPPLRRGERQEQTGVPSRPAAGAAAALRVEPGRNSVGTRAGTDVRPTATRPCLPRSACRSPAAPRCAAARSGGWNGAAGPLAPPRTPQGRPE
jgi:hypothetical protein